jgi:hypothetical protein
VLPSSRAIAADFYGEDVETHYRDLLAYQKPELQGDEWTDAEALSQVAD